MRHFVHDLGEILAEIFKNVILILNPFIHELGLLIDILLELSEGALGLLLSRNTILFELCREFLQLCNFSILNLIYLGVFLLLVCGHTTGHRDYPQVFGWGFVNFSMSSLGRRAARVLRERSCRSELAAVAVNQRLGGWTPSRAAGGRRLCGRGAA